jgi:YidC/Oxa1 family membrane protein insertase
VLSHTVLGAENSLFHLIGEIFHPLFELFGLILAGLYAVWPNYGFAITGLTVLIMLALTPVTVKSTKSMLAMQRLQPEMKKLQAKYKGAENRELLNQEMMRLYKENGTSPFGACLPSLLQMPFLIVLYTLIRGLSTTVSHGQKYVNQAGQYVTCHRVACGAPKYIPTNSQMHSSLVASQGQMHWWFGMDLSSYPFSNHTTDPFTHVVTTSVSQAVLVIPYLVLIAAAMFLQYYQMRQMNSRNPQAAAANPQMQTMQKFFPLIFGLIYLRVPAGATIYMVVSSAMRIGTQEVMFRTGMVEPVAVEREIGSAKEDKPPPKPPPKQPRRSGATDGTSTAKGTAPPSAKGNVAPKAGAGSNGRSNPNGRKPTGRKTNGKSGADAPAPAQKSHPRSRSKRARKPR